MPLKISLAMTMKAAVPTIILTKTMILYHDLLRCCQDSGIAADDKVATVGNYLLKERRLYRKDADSLRDLAEYIHKTLLWIAGYLTDVSLFLQVLLAHEIGYRVIIFAGVAHIKRLRALIIDRGFCANDEQKLQAQIDFTTYELNLAFLPDQHKCQLGRNCRYPFTREQPKNRLLLAHLRCGCSNSLHEI